MELIRRMKNAWFVSMCRAYAFGPGQSPRGPDRAPPLCRPPNEHCDARDHADRDARHEEDPEGHAHIVQRRERREATSHVGRVVARSAERFHERAYGGERKEHEHHDSQHGLP